MTRRTLTLRTTILLLAILPLLGSAILSAVLVRELSNTHSEQQIAVIERDWMRAKREELINYMNLALTSIGPIYHNSDGDEEAAKARVKQIINRLTYGEDGYFFIYDFAGENLVHPKQSFRVGRNWIDLRDANGDAVIRNLIGVARQGGGFHTYFWEKPSTGAAAEKIAYAVALDKWGWMIGTGLYIDDIQSQLARVRDDVERGIDDTFLLNAGITVAAVAVVAVFGLMITLSERRSADAQLRALTKRIIDTQEEERGRVARELHDGISQILVSARFALEKTQMASGAKDHLIAEPLQRGVERVGLAVREVRRISRALRPSQLDDLGLSPAIESLVAEFGRRTGVQTSVQTAAVRNLLSNDAKTALYRVAQEALTNIERHAQARRVAVMLAMREGACVLRVVDDGIGFSAEGVDAKGPGLGLRNMRERMAQLGGTLRVVDLKSRAPNARGVEVSAIVPRRHVLSGGVREHQEDIHV